MDLIEQGQDYNKYQLNEFQQQLEIAPNLNYLGQGGEWLPTDLKWEVSPHPSADYQMVRAPFRVYALGTYAAAKQVRFAKGLHYVDFTALPIYYRSSTGALSLVSQPRTAIARVEGDTLIWDSPYGGNTSLEWTVTARGMNKYFNVASKSVFPNPPVGFRQNATLEIPFRLDFSMNVSLKLLSGLWDLLTDTASDVIEFAEGGASRFSFRRPYFTDANGDIYWGTYRVRKSLTDVIVSSSFKISDLNNAVYPIRIDPSISQEIVDTNATVGISNSTDNTSFSVTNNQIGTLTGGGTVNAQVAWTFLGVPLPQYAEITDAKLNTYFSSKNGTVTLDARFTAEDVANSSLITSFSDFFARVRTTAQVIVPINTTLYAQGALIPVNVTSFVQAIVNKSGWASGNALTFFAQDDSGTLTTANRVTFRNEQWSAAFRNYLTVTYNNPPPTPNAPTNVSAAASPNPIKISVNWTKATYAVQHRIYRNNVLLTTVGDVSTYVDTTVVKGTSYNYAVESVDQYGRIGGKSANTSNITVDNTAPTMNARVRGR